MTATNHGLTGAAIALAVKKPELAIPLAFLSHFALDAIPHYGPRRFAISRYINVLVIDAMLGVLALIILMLVFPEHRWLIFFSMAAAVSPDLAWAKYTKELEKGDKRAVDQFSRWHWTIQWKEFPRGILVELGWAILMCFLIFGLE